MYFVCYYNLQISRNIKHSTATPELPPRSRFKLVSESLNYVDSGYAEGSNMCCGESIEPVWNQLKTSFCYLAKEICDKTKISLSICLE